MFCEEERENIEVIEEFVSSVIQDIYYWLNLSRSDFEKCRMRLLWIFYNNIGLSKKWLY